MGLISILNHGTDESSKNMEGTTDAIQSSQEEIYYELKTSRRSYGIGFGSFTGSYAALAAVFYFSYAWMGVSAVEFLVWSEIVVAISCVPFILMNGILYFPSLVRKIRLLVVPARRIVMLESVSLRGGKPFSLRGFPIDDIKSVDYIDRTSGDYETEKVIEKCRVSIRFNDGHRVTIADTEDVNPAISFTTNCNAAIMRVKGC
jgi:hypothetical protein